uniref:PhoLip_ATPase_C domain-containing protein n=1 Tax=Panagrellus redivivus TaxID=6233 RepID=A0A7E4VIH0_PANRE
MRTLMITEVVCNFCNLTAFFVYLISNDFWFKILVHYVWQWIALSFASVVMVIFVSNGALPTVKQLYQSLRRNRVTPRTPDPLSIKTTMGEQMVFQSHQEADVYFIQLAQSWK